MVIFSFFLLYIQRILYCFCICQNRQAVNILGQCFGTRLSDMYNILSVCTVPVLFQTAHRIVIDRVCKRTVFNQHRISLGIQHTGLQLVFHGFGVDKDV